MPINLTTEIHKKAEENKGYQVAELILLVLGFSAVLLLQCCNCYSTFFNRKRKGAYIDNHQARGVSGTRSTTFDPGMPFPPFIIPEGPCFPSPFPLDMQRTQSMKPQ